MVVGLILALHAIDTAAYKYRINVGQWCTNTGGYGTIIEEKELPEKWGHSSNTKQLMVPVHKPCLSYTEKVDGATPASRLLLSYCLDGSFNDAIFWVTVWGNLETSPYPSLRVTWQLHCTWSSKSLSLSYRRSVLYETNRCWISGEARHEHVVSKELMWSKLPPQNNYYNNCFVR